MSTLVIFNQMRVAFIVLFIFTLNSYVLAEKEETSHASADERLRNAIVKTIIAKVTNLTLHAFARVPPEEKEHMLLKIRNKLRKASSFMGPEGEKYVEIVMEGVEAIEFGDGTDSRKSMPHPHQIKTEDKTKVKKPASKDRHGRNENSVKSKLVKSIVKKVKTLTKVAFNNVKTMEEKQKIMENIKERVTEAAKKHKVMVRSENEIKPYGDLVAEGVELVLQQSFDKDTDKRSDLKFRGRTKTENENIATHELSGDSTHVANTENSRLYTSKQDSCGCPCVLEKICNKLSNLHKFSCHDDKRLIPIEQLCDDEPNCSDQSDERQCARNALKKLEDASHVLVDIQDILPRRCLKTSLEQTILSKQNMILNKVLDYQLQFLRKYETLKDDQFKKFNNTVVKGIVNEVGVVVSVGGLALQAAFCADDIENTLSRRVGMTTEEDVDDLFTDRSWVPPTCTCNKQNCVNGNCTFACRRTCWQRYSLGRWNCPAISGKISVSLDHICDGKIDCYDESDETGCSTGRAVQKFEATEIYNTVLKMLSTKTVLAEYHPVFNKMNALQESIKELQNNSTKEGIDAPTVRSLRQKCVSQLRDIYDDIKAKADVLEQVDEAYLLFTSVNEKLVQAMKLSKTGNEKLVSNDECTCLGARCSTPECSRTCVRACFIKPKLSKYFCKDSLNKSVSITKICNGKPDCPRRDDEEKCKIDVCRRHHLVVLRNTIQNAKNDFKGNALEDTIKAWKTKATKTVLVKESTGLLNRRGLQSAVAEVLHDLTMTYASLGNFRKTGLEENTNGFFTLARLVQDTLRTCTK